MTSKEALKVLEYDLMDDKPIFTLDERIEAYNIIKKDLEILKMLLEKEVDIYWLTHSMDAEQYNKGCGFSEFSTHLLDDKEFEILQKRALGLKNEN